MINSFQRTKATLIKPNTGPENFGFTFTKRKKNVL